MYDVGQVVFVISDKHKRVLPVRVVEQVVRRTLEGETVEYKVQGDSSKQTFNLSSIGTQHFVSAAAVKKHMCDNAVSTIDEIVNAALTVARDKYGYQEYSDDFPADSVGLPEDVFVNSSEAAEPTENGKMKIQLPDGSYANITVPEV